MMHDVTSRWGVSVIRYTPYLLAVLLLASSLGACGPALDAGSAGSSTGSGSSSIPNPVVSFEPAPPGRLASSLTALFRQYLDDPSWSGDLSPLEDEVISRAAQTGSISASDYEMAFSTFMTCMDQHGAGDWPQAKGVDGVYHPQAYNSKTVGFTESQLHAAQDVCESQIDAIQWLYTMQQSNPDLLSDSDEQVVACLRRNGIIDASYTAEDFKKVIQSANFSLFPFDVYESNANACLAAANYLFLRYDGPA